MGTKIIILINLFFLGWFAWLNWSNLPRGKMQPVFPQFPLWESSQSRRQRLMDEFGNWILSASAPKKIKASGILDLPKYKFYTLLFLRLTHYSRKYGLSLGPVLRSLKEGLIQDDRFERKAQKDLLGILLQFAFIIVVTWSFILVSQRVLTISSSSYGSSGTLGSLQVPLRVYFVIALSHFLGLLFFFWGNEMMKRKILRPFSSCLAGLYTFPALMEVGVPLSLALKESQLKGVFNNREKTFVPLRRKLHSLLEELQKKGGVLQGEFREMVQEVWFLMDEAYQEFLQKLQILKFFLLVCCYLTSYFFYLLQLFKLALSPPDFPSTF